MKVKIYIERFFKLATAVGGFLIVALASPFAVADERSLTEQLEAAESARVADEAGIHGTRQWAGFEMEKDNLQYGIDVAQGIRERARNGLKLRREEYLDAKKAYRWALNNDTDSDRINLEEYRKSLEIAETRYEAAKENFSLKRDIAKLERSRMVDRLVTAAQRLRYANKVYNRETGHWETEHSFFEALGEHGSLAKGSSDEKGAQSVNGRALGLKLSETLGKSSEWASEHADASFIRDKVDVFKNENNREFKFAKEDYFDDFKDRHEKGTADKVARDILEKNREEKIERIASAAERHEERRAEKAAKNEEKAEVKAEKRAEKEDKKAEKRAEKEDKEDDKKDDDKKDSGDDGGKKGKKER